MRAEGPLDLSDIGDPRLISRGYRRLASQPAQPLRRGPGRRGRGPGGGGTRRLAFRSDDGSVPSSATAAASAVDAPPARAASDAVGPQRARAHVHEPDAGRCRCARAATPTMAQSWARRLNFWNDQPAPATFGNADLGEQLGGRQRRLEEPREEVVDRDRALAVRAPSHERGAQRQEHRGKVGRAVAVSERAADRAAVTDLRVADLRRRVAQDRRLGGKEVARLEVAVAGERRRWRRDRRRRARRTARDRRPMSTSTDGRRPAAASSAGGASGRRRGAWPRRRAPRAAAMAASAESART